MKITLTALSLMLVLGSVSSAQAALSPAATQQRTTVTSDVSETHSTVARPAEGDFAATHTVNTHLGTFGVDANRIDHERPQGKANVCNATNPGTC